MERQVVRFKERLKHRRGGKNEGAQKAGSIEDDELSYEDIIRRDYGGEP
jgi:hypothetical protein